MPTGTVRWFNARRGYGFIAEDDGGDVFVHRAGLDGERLPYEGDRVDYLVDTHPKGPVAVGVRIVEPAKRPAGKRKLPLVNPVPRGGGCGCTGCCCGTAAR